MRGSLTALIVAGLIAIPATAQSQPAGSSPTSDVRRVRSNDGVLATLITRATKESATFRRLMDSIDASDGIVYIEPGTCRHGVRACLVKITATGQSRFVFVKVDVNRTNCALMAAIGHELQHAVEVLNNPTVKDLKTLYVFYKQQFERIGTSMRFETKAAIAAGDAIAAEIGTYLADAADEKGRTASEKE